MLIKKHNRITIKNPALVGEWDYEKNGELNPDDFAAASHKKIWRWANCVDACLKTRS